MQIKTVAIVSGGMDSVTLAHMLHEENDDLLLLGFDYGQRHVKELEYARSCAVRLGMEYAEIDLLSVGGLLRGSALTDSNVEVPDGHYAADVMRKTIVPNRNAIFLSIACAVAVANEADCVAIGVHAGDHPVYPDCRPDFIDAFEKMVRLATGTELKIHAPFVHFSKVDIVRFGYGLGVPYVETWSCYKGGDVHCGTCGTCVERREAFKLAGVVDPTVYASTGKPG